MKKKNVKKAAAKKPAKKVVAKKPVAQKKKAVKIVKSKETAKNKKTSKIKWVKSGPKKLPKVKLNKKKAPAKVPAVSFPEPEVHLVDLSKLNPMREKYPEQTDPVSGAPKPWGSIMPPFVPATATAPQRATAIWVGPEPTMSGVSASGSSPVSATFRAAIGSVDPSANWTPVMPKR